jgi:hypothetical protein
LKNIKTLTMADLIPPPHSPDLVPHEVTKGEINIAHAPQSSPVCVDNAPVVNLFYNLQGVSQNKRLSILTERSSHTPATKKQSRTTCCASSVKSRGAIQDLLAAALHVDKSFDWGSELSNLHRTIITTNGYDASDEHNKDNKLDNNNYHPTSIVPPPLHDCVQKRSLSQSKCLIALL